MHFVPSRLPKLLGATTIAALLALLLALLEATHADPNRRASLPSLFSAHITSDSTFGWRTREATPARIVFEGQLDALSGALDSLAIALEHFSPRDTPRAFRHARLGYMRAESLLEVYSPTTARALNGPLENDDGDAPPRALGSPAGFQVVLSALGAAATNERVAARTLALAMRDQVRHLRGQTRYLDVAELPVLESQRTELARVTTLGLAGFDLDDPSNAVREATASLEGMRAVAESEASAEVLRKRDDISRDAWLRVARTLRGAEGYLRAHPDFQQLNRLEFITRFVNPAARAVADARAPLLARASPLRRVWRASAATLFEPRALDPSAFAPDFAPAPNAVLIALGARLFSDSRLSGAQDRSCATCHQPSRAFTDGRARPVLIGADTTTPAIARGTPVRGTPVRGTLARNTPTLLDVAYQPLYFADERALSLEDQIGIVLASPTEMGSSADRAAQHLARDSTVRSDFAHAFRGRADVFPSGRNVRIALAAYLRSLDSFDSRFDRAARGDTLALTARERLGFTVFMGKARCGTCHFAPLFSGVMPPGFTSSEPEVIGAAVRPTLHHAHVDPDSGRAGVDHLPEHLFAFKVPTLRNVGITAPYMHNGAYARLESVIDFYEHGGGAGLGAHLSNQTLPSARLHLTSAQRRALLAFLRALTDTTSSPIPPPVPLQQKAIAAR